MGSTCASSGPRSGVRNGPSFQRNESQKSALHSVAYQLRVYISGSENSLNSDMTVSLPQHLPCGVRVAAGVRREGITWHPRATRLGVDAMRSTHRIRTVIRPIMVKGLGATEEEALFPHPSARLGLPTLPTCR